VGRFLLFPQLGIDLPKMIAHLRMLRRRPRSSFSFRDNLDLSTPSGRLMFQIIGAMAEFERSLIQERVRAGLRNARAKGKKFGRPRVEIDAVRVAALRRDGLSWSQVCRTLQVSKGSAQRSVACVGREVSRKSRLGTSCSPTGNYSIPGRKRAKSTGNGTDELSGWSDRQLLARFHHISTNNTAYSDGIPNCGNKSSLFIRESLLGA
jgi:hypothetical protein